MERSRRPPRRSGLAQLTHLMLSTTPAQRPLFSKAALGPVRLVTTDEVLTEFLNALADGGEHLRRQAAKMVRAIQANTNITVLPQSRDSFVRALDLFERRRDKNYSLTDCVSMNAMREKGLSHVLTNDHGFEYAFTLATLRW